jgi:two-component system CheB/CheR fusion protein
MPKSAIATGCVDFVLPPAEIAQELMRINRHPLLAVPGSVKPEKLQGGATSFEPILHLLHRATGMDFSLYKQGTLQRRIRRRLVIHRLNSLEVYVNFLRETPAEIDALTEDLFIKVTGFFREPAREPKSPSPFPLGRINWQDDHRTYKLPQFRLFLHPIPNSSPVAIFNPAFYGP